MTSLRLKFTVACGAVSALILVWTSWVLTFGFQEVMEEEDVRNMTETAHLVAAFWEAADGCALPEPGGILERLYPEIELVSGLSIFAYCGDDLAARYGTAPLPADSSLSPPDFEDVEKGYHIRYEGFPMRNGRIVVTSEHPQLGDLYIAVALTRLFWPAVGLVLCALVLWRLGHSWFHPVHRLADNALGQEECPVELLPLRQRLADLSAEKDATVDRLDARLETERQFTANAAHELLTPLAAIKAEVQLQQSLTGDPAMREVFGEISSRVDRASHTVDQLMTLARLEPESTHADPGEIDLSALLRESVAGFGAHVTGKSLALSTQVPDGLAVVGYADALRIMFKNLIDNAIRYSPEGGRLGIRLCPVDGGVSFTISNDCRQRVPQYLIEHMGQRFVRGAGEPETGSGLGMSIVERCAKLHGAEVSIRPSDDNMHLAVSMRLPGREA